MTVATRSIDTSQLESPESSDQEVGSKRHLSDKTDRDSKIRKVEKDDEMIQLKLEDTIPR